jgi:hypothetical protein
MPRKRTPAEITGINADLRARFGSTLTRQNMLDYETETGIFAVWIYRDPACKAGRGIYRIPTAGETATSTPVVAVAKTPKASKTTPTPTPVAITSTTVNVDVPASVLSASDLQSADIHTRMAMIRQQASLLSSIPSKDPAFVPFGDFDMIRTVVKSRKFFPVFVTGLSGNGKTFQIRQACAMEGREYIRVNITAETDEDDLIGGFRLINGNTVFELGPVLVAMLRGAVLLIDEIDYASPKIACLQPVLEGNAITVKKLGITITPEPGFTAFATANTKGRGDENGKFVGANLLNEAFMDRFPVTVEQEYPSIAVEKKILAKNFVAEGYTLTDEAKIFFDTLAKWADGIRSTYAAGGIEDLIATRRLCHIVKAFGMFGYDQQMALSYCVNRFEPKVKDAFIDLYNKLAPDEAAPDSVGTLDAD